MSSKYFPPYVIGKSNNVKVVLNLSGGYLRNDDKTLAKKEDLDYFLGKNCFDGDDGAQYYLIFQVKKNILKNKILSTAPLVLLLFMIKHGDQKAHQIKNLAITTVE